VTAATRVGAWLFATMMVSACGAPAPDDVDARVESDAAVGCEQGDAAALPDGRSVGGHYASRVVSFSPGPGATYGADQLPGVVLGPPVGGGDFRGSTDVVSLGAGGEIVLGFDVDIIDGPGDDFTVFENPFAVPGASDRFWEELGEVAVSLDGVTWTTFACDPSGPRPHVGCAGWNVVYASPESGFCATDPRVSGGDGFDLARVGVARARFVRVRDLRTQGYAAPSTGFDLDAIAVLHAARP
jgi:hypothetical protein